MSLSRKADYALRAMVELANKPDRLLSTADLAEKAQVPYAFMSKIINELSNHGLAEVFRGSKGGIRISTDPRKTTALDIVEIINGALSLNQCIDQKESCSRSSFCSMRDMLVVAQRDLKKSLSVDLETLANTQKVKQKKTLCQNA